MLTFTEGNLLAADTEALVNTVNEVGVMGKGIALMFKEAYPENNREYELACKRGGVKIGRMLITENRAHFGPKWIINFPTKKHWRNPSKLEWIKEGLNDLRGAILERNIKSIAIPPLGCGNGGLEWRDVQPLIAASLGSLSSVDVKVFAPTAKYQNSAKKSGTGRLTPARALVAEMIRRYEVLGFECSLLEVQKLAWFLRRGLKATRVQDPLKLTFIAGKYGPYSDTLRHLLDGLDGSYLHSAKRIADAKRDDVVTFEYGKGEALDKYLTSSQMVKYSGAVRWTQTMIEGFESPYGMELLATVDWLIVEQHVEPEVDQIRTAIHRWPHSDRAATRKTNLFDDRVLGIAIRRILSASKFEVVQRELLLQ